MIPAISSGLVFIATYALIFSGKVHRTSAALAGAVAMIAVGIGLGFYDFDRAVEAVDFNTIGLLLGMMIIVGIIQPTGAFQYFAIRLSQASRGRPWLLFLGLSWFTALVSTVLDNVTTVVIVAPVTVSIAEVMGINPIPFLLGEAVLSNIGGVATLVGDPPNIIIGSAADLSFNDFLTHLGPVVLAVLLVSTTVFPFLFRREFRARPENLENLERLDARRALVDPVTMHRMSWVLGFTVLLYFVHEPLRLPPGLVALIGAVAGLLWVRPKVEEVMNLIHWDVLLFFIGLFVVVGGLESAGVLGLVTQELGTLARSGVLIASVAVLWLSALMSAAVDNIPFTIAMVPVIRALGAQGALTAPLWWALALGVGFGGNATPIGATANVVVISVSERTPHPISTRRWISSATLIAFLSCLIATLFLILGIETGWYM
ncbi:ArsB/NhaD family transporter [Candidatus Bipolaricaulota sp. J31]